MPPVCLFTGGVYQEIGSYVMEDGEPKKKKDDQGEIRTHANEN